VNDKITRGDIVLAQFPFTDLSGSKRRPAVLLAAYSPDVIVAFISSVVPTVPEPYDLLLLPSSPFFAAAGLKKASVLRLRKLATLERLLITRLLGKLDAALLTAVDEALIASLGIDKDRIIDETYRQLFAILESAGEAAVISHIQSSV
jgi:mRNA interferase MazF